MKVVILCGGIGTRLREETETRPKPMVEIGGMPIVWHIMKIYACYGFKEFILCLGYKGNMIKEYFYNYEILSNDFTIELGTKNIEIYSCHSETGWKVTLVDTGSEAMTGARVKRAEKFIDSEDFMLTYGDGVSDVDIKRLLAYHKQHKKIGTVTGVTPPSRYGELMISGDHVLAFSEKPNEVKDSINGGYFVFNRRIFNYLSNDDNCILEKGPLQSIVSDNELKVYQHKGFWQCMDTYRDYKYLQSLWEKGEAPWKIW